jgi:DUF4097 and DUF4098 domain-containing protein YvlB
MQRVEHFEPTMGGALAALDVRCDVGAITVRSAGTDSITVRVTSHDVDADELVAGTRIERRGDPAREEIVVEVPRRQFSMASMSILGFSVHRSGGVSVEVDVPEGTDCKIRSASARVTLTGCEGDVDVTTASGDVSCEVASGRFDCETASGRCELGQVHGRLGVHTASGRVAVDTVGGEVARIDAASGSILVGQAAGSVELRSASGSIRLRRAGEAVELRSASGSVRADELDAGGSIKTVSGKIEVGSASSGTLRAETVSGNCRIGVVVGTAVQVDASTMSGRVSSEIDLDDDPDPSAGAAPRHLRIEARSLSGDIRIVRAARSDPAAAAIA